MRKLTKLERKLRRRERLRMADANRNDPEIFAVFVRVTLTWLAIIIGVIIWLWAASVQARDQAYAATAVSIPPRCKYVGAIPEVAETGGEPPRAINESPVATFPDAEMVEPVGEPPERWECLGRWLLTAYCPLDCCNGKGRAWKTASEAKMVVGDTVAVNSLPFGTKIRIGDHVYTVADRGNLGKHHVDILHGSHKAAENFGMQYADVWILKDN